MKMLTVNAQTQLSVFECAVCFITFGAPVALLDKRHETGGSIYCPNGHSLTYVETELQRAQRQLAKAQELANREAQRATDLDKLLKAVEASKRRLERRVQNGVCPTCHRSFQNLRRHMETKHTKH